MKVGVLASGSGTNLQALLDQVHGREGIEIVAVGSNVADSPALERARRAGVPTRPFPEADRARRDAQMADWLEEQGVELVVLAGYMRLITPAFLERFPRRVINVHPALLPAFPGLRSIEQAVEYGVKVFGVTVHFVDDGVDSGPIIFQRAIELDAPHDAATVHRALQPLEHELLPAAVRAIAAGAVRFDPDHPRRVYVSFDD
jgi:phosphoribosylglycinamide formyltransferase-1